jgi:hypothetical protein
MYSLATSEMRHVFKQRSGAAARAGASWPYERVPYDAHGVLVDRTSVAKFGFILDLQSTTLTGLFAVEKGSSAQDTGAIKFPI